jgi:hypothetical protein
MQMGRRLRAILINTQHLEAQNYHGPYSQTSSNYYSDPSTSQGDHDNATQTHKTHKTARSTIPTAGKPLSSKGVFVATVSAQHCSESHD